MSRSRQSRTATPSVEIPDGPLVPSGDETTPVSSVAADFDAGHRIGRHRHRRAQLVYAVEGVMTVRTDAGLWVVPPLRALWVAPGVAHSIRMTGRVRMRTIYFDRTTLDGVAVLPRCAVVSVSPLLRELVLKLVELDDGGDAGRREHLVALLLGELAAAPVDALEVPMPADPRLRRVADALLADPSDGRDAGAWARVAGVSERTLARRFPEETGMTLVRWRQQVRLLGALERLALGESVTAVALDMGYSSTSAFVKLFRENLGVTPGRYFQG